MVPGIVSDHILQQQSSTWMLITEFWCLRCYSVKKNIRNSFFYDGEFYYFLQLQDVIIIGEC